MPAVLGKKVENNIQRIPACTLFIFHRTAVLQSGIPVGSVFFVCSMLLEVYLEESAVCRFCIDNCMICSSELLR